MKDPEVSTEERLNLAGEYVRGRKESKGDPFRGLDDYILCVRLMMKNGTAHFETPSVNETRPAMKLVETQDVTLLLSALDLD